MAEIDSTLQRITQNKSVVGLLVLDENNKIIHKQFNKSVDPEKYADKLPPLIERARCLVRDLDPTNDLTFLRIRTDKIEIMVAPDDEYLLIVIQSVIVIDA
ncbi:hypothetical protein M9Y10_023458 [Tritrichomonas musculus]|uniref:Dynein light chain roadblock n=1 Tax=Tritrichomonas musculus TaxID=1915356 RepID=A0ABR2KVC7_9EUKA